MLYMTYLISTQYKMDCFFVCLFTLWIVTGGTVPLSSVSFSFWVNGLVCYGSWVWVHLLVLQEHQNTIKLHVSLGLRSDEELQHLGEERKREKRRLDGTRGQTMLFCLIWSKFKFKVKKLRMRIFNKKKTNDAAPPPHSPPLILRVHLTIWTLATTDAYSCWLDH